MIPQLLCIFMLLTSSVDCSKVSIFWKPESLYAQETIDIFGFCEAIHCPIGGKNIYW